MYKLILNNEYRQKKTCCLFLYNEDCISASFRDAKLKLNRDRPFDIFLLEFI